MPDDLDHVRGPLSEATEQIRRRLKSHGSVLPLWLGRILEQLARRCFARGVAHVHQRPTPRQNPWQDDEETPVVDQWQGREKR